jgi:[ribosomal protein S5]-alanine N-acetyltransferase
MRTPPKRFVTPRLELRAPLAAAARDFFQACCQDSGIVRYMAWKKHATPAETKAVLRVFQERWTKKTAFTWMLFHKKDKKYIGSISLCPDMRNLREHEVHLAYMLGRKYWHQGLMLEAARAVFHWACKQKDIVRISAQCAAKNAASEKLMERLGMEREGYQRLGLRMPNAGNRYFDCVLRSYVKQTVSKRR